MAFPATQTVSFGALTRAGYGGHDLGYTGSGTLAVTGGVNAAHWTISNINELVPAGTYGGAPSATLSGPYTITVSDGTVSSTVTITLEPQTYTVGTRLTGATATGVNGAADPTGLDQIKAATDVVNYGQTIRLRDGRTFGDTSPLSTSVLTMRRTTAIGGTLDLINDNRVVIQPETPLGATLVSITFNGNRGALYHIADGIRLQSVKFRRLKDISLQSTAITIISGSSGASYIDIFDCDIEGDMNDPFNIATCDGIQAALHSHGWRVRRNRVAGVGKGVYLNNPIGLTNPADNSSLPTGQGDHSSSVGIAHEVTNNLLRRIGYDEINISNGTGALVTDNVIVDKWSAVKPYPGTPNAGSATSALSPYFTGAGGQPHGDGIQVDYSSIKFGSVDGCIIERNIWLRGAARDTMPWYTAANYGATDSVGKVPNPNAPFPDTQGIFVTNNGTDKAARGAVSGAGGYPCVVKNLVIRNNGYLRGYVRGISVEQCENPIIEFNTILAEKSVPLLPSVSSAGQIFASNVSGTQGRIRGNISAAVTVSYVNGGAALVEDNVIVTYADDYALTFAAPVYGPSVQSLAAWSAAYRPRAAGRALLTGGRCAGMFFQDGSFNTGLGFSAGGGGGGGGGGIAAGAAKRGFMRARLHIRLT